MSYQMIHLEVAYRLLDKYKWIQKPADFIMGSIAPDAVHMNPAYEVCRKEASHVWNCGPRWGVTTESEKWKNNIAAFWEAHKEDENRDFIAGYSVHLLTDWFNDLRIWSPFREKLLKGADYEETYKAYRQEALGSDQWLYRNSNNTKAIMDLLSRSRTYSVTGCVSKEEVECLKKHILSVQYQNAQEYDICSYKYCTEQVMNAFIEECVETCSRLLIYS